MSDPPLRGVLSLDMPDGGHVGALQAEGARWLPRDARPLPAETVHPDVESARAWLLAQPRPPAPDALAPGAERLAGMIVRRIFGVDGLQAVQILGGRPQPEAFVTALPPAGKRGIPRPRRRPGALIASGTPATDGTPRFLLLLLWADHGETGEPVAWPPESRRRGARPLLDALLEAGDVRLETAHARQAWRTAVLGPWPAWPETNPFAEPGG
jgi:hypothetical protein